MLAQLQALAREKSSDKRRELLGRVADLFFSCAPDLRGESEVALWAEVVILLLRAMPEPDRAEFAGHHAGRPDLPRPVATLLAGDEIAVAQPMLHKSPVLTETDLVDVAQSRTPDHRFAIAERDNIGVAVTDALIEFEEPRVLQALVDNLSAKISSAGFRRLRQQAEADPALGEQLGERRDLPIDVALRLLPILPMQARQKLEYLITADRDTVKGLVQQATARVSAVNLERANRRLQIKADGRKFKDDQHLRDVWISNTATQGHITDVLLVLAEITGLPEQQVTNALVSVEISALAVLCRSLELRFETFALLNNLRCQRVRLPVTGENELRELYASVTDDGARRAMSFVKVRSTVGKQQAS